MTTRPLRLHWFQFSLRTLMVVVTLCAILFSWRETKLRKARTQEEAIAKVFAKGGFVTLDSPDGSSLITLGPNTFPKGWLQKHRATYWRRVLFGDTDLENFRAVVLCAWMPADDEDLRNLACLDTLRELSLNSSPIARASVTNDGLKHLEGLTRLERLDIHGLEITDAGLEHLKGLANLKELDLRGSEVTKAGVQKLQQALPNCRITR